jgi:hypothetical protein
MDPDFLAILIFVVIITGMIGGGILLFPITRRLGRLLEQRLEAGKGGEPANLSVELAKLHASTLALRREVERLTERQEFTESLLAERQALGSETAPLRIARESGEG